MIKNNKTIIIFLGILAAISSLAQDRGAGIDLIDVNDPKSRIVNNYPDTIKLTTDEGVELTFAFDRISNKHTYYNNELWKSTISVMETAARNSSIEGGKRVTYGKKTSGGEEKAHIEVSSLPENEIYQISASGTKELKIHRIVFEIRQKYLLVSFALNDLNDLESVKEINIETLWSQIEQKYSDEGKRNLYFGEGQFNYGNAQINSLGAKDIGIDNIEITFIGVGIGYYRDRFVPDIGSSLSFNLHDRLGNEWMNFGFLYTQQFFFSRDQNDDYQLDRNGWLTGFWKITTKSGAGFGVGIGGLIHRDGGYFDGSTWKLSLYNRGADSKLSISPELIITDDFKEVFPALRFGLSF